MKRNQFKIYFDEQTIGMNRTEKEQFRQQLQEKLQVTSCVMRNWLSGKTIPNGLQQIAINKILKTKIY